VPPTPVMERPRRARGLGYGLAVALAVAMAAVLVRGILELAVGTIALAAVGGWLIGAAVRMGAWGGQAHRPSSAPTLMSAGLGALCWVAGLVGDWIVAMAILPASSRTLAERLVGMPFLDWLSPQLGLADVLSLPLLVGFAWFGARSPATPP
jgi:hypothetical protein